MNRILVLGQREWEGSLWVPSIFEETPDAEYVSQSFKLAGWGRQVGALSEEDFSRLWYLLANKKHRASPDDKREIDDFLEACPYTSHRIPFFDIDVAKNLSPDDTFKAAALAADYARAIDHYAPKFGLGTPTWSVSNVRGGLHGRSSSPQFLVQHALLPAALAEMMRRMALEAGIPLISELPSKKDERLSAGFPVFLDDRYFVAGVRSQGRQWRLEGVPKPDGIYIPVDLAPTGLHPISGRGWGKGSPIDHEVLLATIEVLIGRALEEKRLRDEQRASRAAALEELRRTNPTRAASLEAWSPAWLAKTRRGIIDDVRNAGAGARNDTLYISAARAGNLVAGGAFDQSIVNEIEAAALSDRDANQKKIADTLRRGFEDGLLQPAAPPLPPVDLIQPSSAPAPPPVVDEKTAHALTPVQSWLEQRTKGLEAPAIESVLRAFVGALLRYDPMADAAALEALSALESPVKARVRVNLSKARVLEKKRISGAAFLRRTFGYWSVLELALALAKTLTRGAIVRDHVEIARSLLGTGLVRDKKEVTFLRDIHSSLLPSDKIRKATLTPTGCLRWHEQVEAVKMGGGVRDLGILTKACDTVACPHCFLGRVKWENEILKKDWQNKGPFWVFAIEDIPDTAAATKVLAEITTMRFPKLRAHGFARGKHSVLVITNDPRAAAGLYGSLLPAAEDAGGTFSRKHVFDHLDVVSLLMKSRIEVHVHERDLLAREQKSEYIAWLRWRKGRQLVSRSPKLKLSFPSREVIRDTAADASDKPRLDLTDVAEDEVVAYTIRHTETGIHVGERRAQYPRPLYACQRAGEDSGVLRSTLEALDAPHDMENELWLDRKLREELAREAAVPLLV